MGRCSAQLPSLTPGESERGGRFLVINKRRQRPRLFGVSWNRKTTPCATPIAIPLIWARAFFVFFFSPSPFFSRKQEACNLYFHSVPLEKGLTKRRILRGGDVSATVR